MHERCAYIIPKAILERVQAQCIVKRFLFLFFKLHLVTASLVGLLLSQQNVLKCRRDNVRQLEY